MQLLCRLALVIGVAARYREARIDTRQNRREYQANPVERGHPYFVEPQNYNGISHPLPMYLFPWQQAELPKFMAQHPEGNWDAPRPTDSSPPSAYGLKAWERSGGLHPELTQEQRDLEHYVKAFPELLNNHEVHSMDVIVEEEFPFVDPYLLDRYVAWPKGGCRNCTV